IPSLLRNGIGEFLQSYEIKNAYLDFLALPSESEHERKEKIAVLQQINDILGQPAAYADRVRVENANVTVTATENVTRVAGFDLVLEPDKPGQLHLARLEVPGVPVWKNLRAETSYVHRNLFIKGVQLAPELTIDELNFDASRHAQHIGSMDLKMHAFGG